MTSLIALVVSLLVCFGAAFVGSRFLPDDWFRRLNKPSWNPPDRVFAPVWTVLYTLMGIAAWLVWNEVGFARGAVALALFVVQLALNSAWSWFFFGRHRIDQALGDILILWLALLATVIAFLRINVWAGILLLPYLVWVSFASLLNLSILRLNRKNHYAKE
jgi:translocator protein